MFLTDDVRSETSPSLMCVQLFMLAISIPGWRLFQGTLAKLRFDFESFGAFTVASEEPA